MQKESNIKKAPVVNKNASASLIDDPFAYDSDALALASGGSGKGKPVPCLSFMRLLNINNKVRELLVRCSDAPASLFKLGEWVGAVAKAKGKDIYYLHFGYKVKLDAAGYKAYTTFTSHTDSRDSSKDRYSPYDALSQGTAQIKIGEHDNVSIRKSVGLAITQPPKKDGVKRAKMPSVFLAMTALRYKDGILSIACVPFASCDDALAMQREAGII